MPIKFAALVCIPLSSVVYFLLFYLGFMNDTRLHTRLRTEEMYVIYVNMYFKKDFGFVACAGTFCSVLQSCLRASAAHISIALQCVVSIGKKKESASLELFNLCKFHST